jgi:soluble lytic murein transglycosylase
LFQRGLVDYYADAYEPAVTAFNSYIALNPIHREDVHLFLAWSYEGLGNVPAALTEMDNYIEANEPGPAPAVEVDDDQAPSGDLTAVAQGLIERAKLQARAGLLPQAVESYQAYLQRFPAGSEAPFAAWWAASLTRRSGSTSQAIERFVAMAEAYPNHEDADEALFLAGYLSREAGDSAGAIAYWKRTAETYPSQMYGGAALLWLLKTLPEEEAEPYRQQAAGLTGTGYFTLRAVHEAQGLAPFAPADRLDLDIDHTAEQAEAEEWLRTWLQVEPGVNISSLSAALAGDGRLVRGEKLWRLGQYEAAKRELEAARQAYAGDALHTYQLALFFRDLGLYRSSILAAETVMNRARVNAFSSPRFLARLAYPIYFADLITAEAERYGYDPLLQFALIRQESLYESFATSTAVAQGLSQVIPDTGAYIAGQLAWPDFQNEDLYRPYVGIAFGAYYLAQQLEVFDGYIPAALSAYNAGPGNAARWYAQVPDDLDRYHEAVNFAETRLYIERIYTGQSIYRYLYGTVED